MLSIEDKNYYNEGRTTNTVRSAGTANTKKSGFSLIAFLLAAILIGGLIGFLMDKKNPDSSYNSSSDYQLQQLLDNQEAQNAINEEILNRIEELKNQKEKDPVSLIGNKVETSYNDSWDIFTSRNSLTDNVGNSYQNAYSLYANNGANPEEITYILNGEYSSLYGTIAVDESDRDSFREVWVNIYDENNNHIYESSHITREHPNPLYISCNVTDLERVTVQFIGITRDATMGVDLISEGFVLK